MSRLVILGAGTAGTTLANRLRRRFADAVAEGALDLVVIDQDDSHVYQPGLLFVPFGVYEPEEIVRPRSAQLHEEITYRRASVRRVDVEGREVCLADGARLRYDVLVIATGTRVDPALTEGLTGPGWRESRHEFYTLEGATLLHEALTRFERGRLVVSIQDLPIKCPVAPLEFAFLADSWLADLGRRDAVEITYVTPLDAPFTKPVAAARLAHLLEEKRITTVTDFATARVEGAEGEAARAAGAAGALVSWDERVVPFDLLVTVPLHGGAPFVGATPGLGDELGFVRTDPRTLQSRRAPEIFAIGDATDLPASKAGSVAHFQAEVLEENIARFLAGQPLAPAFDGHANCFVETGHHKALLIDFNYDVEPLPGRFPTSLGPLSLLSESRLNHVGKMAFRWVYWHMLLPGHDIPMIPVALSMAGKEPPDHPAAAPPALTTA